MKRISAFVVACAMLALLAWIAGYDFDQRGPLVAVWTAFAGCIAALFSALPCFDGEPHDNR